MKFKSHRALSFEIKPVGTRFELKVNNESDDWNTILISRLQLEMIEDYLRLYLEHNLFGHISFHEGGSNNDFSLSMFKSKIELGLKNSQEGFRFKFGEEDAQLMLGEIWSVL